MTKARSTKLGLGTVQFGMRYGLTSVAKVSEQEAHRILDMAAEYRVRIVDTAAAYGSSEAVVGSYPNLSSRFDVVTKTLPIDAETITREHVAEVERQFETSLRELGSQSVFCVLAHRANNLWAPGGDLLVSAMERWKAEGRVEKIGVSAYDKAEIDGVMSCFHPDVIQVPVNVLDQRLIHNGTLQNLSDAGVEVHARSVFLQGVLLAEPVDLPGFFDPIKPHLLNYRKILAKHRVSPISAALSFVEANEFISAVLVGVQSTQQMTDCVQAVGTQPNIDYGQFALIEERFVDPRLWGEITGAA